jgi:hypothetical protein
VTEPTKLSGDKSNRQNLSQTFPKKQSKDKKERQPEIKLTSSLKKTREKSVDKKEVKFDDQVVTRSISKDAKFSSSPSKKAARNDAIDSPSNKENHVITESLEPYSQHSKSSSKVFLVNRSHEIDGDYKTSNFYQCQDSQPEPNIHRPKNIKPVKVVIKNDQPESTSKPLSSNPSNARLRIVAPDFDIESPKDEKSSNQQDRSQKQAAKKSRVPGKSHTKDNVKDHSECDVDSIDDMHNHQASRLGDSMLSRSRFEESTDLIKSLHEFNRNKRNQ